jgi:hypothetical protein
MPFNLLLLPLLGGYIFVRCWNCTKFYVIRSTNERLLIASSLAGFALLFIAYLSFIIGSYWFPCADYSVCLPEWWARWIPIEYSGISVGAFFLGLLSWIPLNWVFRKEGQIDRVIERDAEPLELLLRRAQKEKLMVSITMATDKVYIGWVAHQFNPGTITNYISLLPRRSGYRHAETKRLVPTVDYTQTLSNIRKEANEIIEKVFALSASDPTAERALVERWLALSKVSNLFLIVIPVSQIVSINFFDADIHQKYFVPQAIEQEQLAKRETLD